MSKPMIQYNFRDVSEGLRKFRDFLLGRKYIKNSRYHPLLSPRTLPPADIPRGPVYKYSDQYYYKRSALDSVHPPVVAPVALGLEQKTSGILKAIGDKKTTTIINFPTLPTPGYAYWWDGHCYYECTKDLPKSPPKPKSPEQPPSPDPCPPVTKPKLVTKSQSLCDPCEPPQRWSRQTKLPELARIYIK